MVITNVTDATLVLAETLVSAKAGTTDLVVVRVVTAPDDATETNLVEPLLLPMFLNITIPDTDGTTPDPDSFGTVSSATPTPGPVFETISDDPSKLGSTAPEAPQAGASIGTGSTPAREPNAQQASPRTVSSPVANPQAPTAGTAQAAQQLPQTDDAVSIWRQVGLALLSLLGLVGLTKRRRRDGGDA